MIPEDTMDLGEQKCIQKSSECQEPTFDLAQYLDEQEKKFLARQKEFNQENS